MYVTVLCGHGSPGYYSKSLTRGTNGILTTVDGIKWGLTCFVKSFITPEGISYHIINSRCGCR